MLPKNSALLSNKDVMTLQSAIQNPMAISVTDFLLMLNDAQAVEQLTKIYRGTLIGPIVPESNGDHDDGGGVQFAADDDDLYAGTSPILHAARSGSAGMFTTVVEAMQDKLTSLKVR